MINTQRALLAAVSLAMASISAGADEVSQLKRHLETVNARIAKLEAAPSGPSGYNLLAFDEGEATKIPGLDEMDAASYSTRTHVIGILPTTDMPASSEVQWSGFVRGAISYIDSEDGLGGGGDDDIDIWTRAELKVAAKTETSVGEVGMIFKLRVNADVVDSRGVKPGFKSPEYWGYWAMTPEWTLGAGRSRSLSGLSYGQFGHISYGTAVDIAGGLVFDDFSGFESSRYNRSQFRMTYSADAVELAVAVEDPVNSGFFSNSEKPAVSARVGYTGETLSGSISGYYESLRFGKDIWQVNSGLEAIMNEAFVFSLLASTGQRLFAEKYVGVTAFAGFNLTDSVSVELSAGKVWNKDFLDYAVYNGGVFWQPAEQLKLGLQADYTDVQRPGSDNLKASAIAWYSF
jgi:hypothetical protein